MANVYQDDQGNYYADANMQVPLTADQAQELIRRKARCPSGS